MTALGQQNALHRHFLFHVTPGDNSTGCLPVFTTSFGLERYVNGRRSERDTEGNIGPNRVCVVRNSDRFKENPSSGTDKALWFVLDARVSTNLLERQQGVGE
ncbi:hypothetical protein RRG08_051719 [Elysia crispata]|uniref:Uncharacterized protein n=1 Tax=Elysia crispata TaxID=231223 RepID=A0AAE1ECW6_9GAST|nr:hypothetical protein RRG08_051719 [Elysia crispata]